MMANLHPPRDAPDLSAMAAISIQSLGDAVRTAYRDNFRVALAEGHAKPMMMPFCLMAPFIVPALWLAIPHTRRRWLYHTRWLVVAFAFWSALYHLRWVSSTNMAFSYAAGLTATWGTMSTMNLIIWTRPQFDAARVLRVRKAKPEPVTGEPNGTANHNGSLLQPNRNGNANGDALRLRKSIPDDRQAVEERHENDEEFEYVWQPYPADRPFLERLGWTLDLILSFRCAGWNWSVSSIPRPKAPLKIRTGGLVDMDSMPQVTRSGYKRCMTEAEFVRNRLIKVVVSYLVLDLLAVFMMKDPYFILGPDHRNYTLPPYLQHIPSWLLLAYREIFSIAGVYGAIEAVSGVVYLFQYWLINRFFPSRGALWQYASSFGSFDQVLDRGLAGWWGAWWHQTFRVPFLAPSTYLVREGYLKKGTQLASVVAVLVSFLQSGLLHAAGSFTSIPRTKAWRPPVFFLLQVVGIMVQQMLSQMVKSFVPRPPRILSRISNLLFTLLWLYLTATFFIDDLASTGLWLLEPVPISPLRFLGVGRPGDHWWRWDRDMFPRIHVGSSWWQSGIAI